MTLKTVKVLSSPKDESIEPFVSQIIHYDRAGHEIANYQFNGPGEFESKTEYTYNARGEMTEETTYQDEHEVAERKTYSYDENGTLNRVDIAFNDGSESVRILEKDPVKKTENWIESDEDGEQETREFQEFNSEGKLVRRELFDHRDKLTEAYEYEYNTEGQAIRRRQLDNRRKLVVETEFKYTAGGLLELRANRNRKGQLSDFIKIEYDEHGRVFRQNLSNKYFFEFQYDENGNTIVEERYAGDELDHRTTYEYDSNNRVLIEEHPDLIKTFSYEFFPDENL